MVLVSAISAWEIALLADAGRINLDVPAVVWFERFLDRVGIESIPLTVRSAATAYSWPNLDHRDPADRLLMSTAIELKCPLVTYDTRIVRFAETFGRAYGLEVATAA